MGRSEILTLAPVEFWGLTLLALGLALFGGYRAFRGLRRARLIEDIPTARIRSAPQGHVELQGVAEAMPGEPILSPLTGMPCCWYRYRVEQQVNDRWRMREKGESDGVFLLRDETGVCVLDPEGAEVHPGHRSVWRGGAGERGLNPGWTRGGGRSGRSTSGGWAGTLGRIGGRLSGRVGGIGGLLGGDYRYTEEVILAGDALYAMGHFKSLDDLDHRSHRRELTRDILREWKQDQATLIERFDQNGDGRIDAAEWEHARAAAAQEAAREYADQQATQDLHTLSRPPDRALPFLLSNLPQRKLARRFRWEAFGGVALFLIGGVVAARLLSAGLGGAG